MMKWGIEQILILQSIPGLTGLMQFFTFLGHEPFYLFLMPAVFWCLDPSLARRMAVVLIASNGLNGLFKIAFHLPRPSWIDPRIKVLSLEKSYGLPSGHAMNAVAFWGFLAAQIKKWWGWLIAMALILIISLSRLYLGVHFSIDLLAGWALGVLFLGIFLTWESSLISWLKGLTFKQHLGLTVGLACLYLFLFNGILLLLAPFPDPAVWAQNAALSGLTPVGAPAINPRNPEYSATLAGTIIGLGLAFSLSGFHLKEFQAGGSGLKRALRFTIGVGGIVILAIGLKRITPLDPLALVMVGRMVRYALIAFWIFYLAPVLFIRIKI